MSAIGETAFAKINLALHVRERLPDGYHRIETLFAFCEHGDEISAEAAKATCLSISGPFATALDRNDNLVTRATQAVRDASGTESGAAIHLRKLLPVASGVGGGSADAAAALRLLNRLWGLGWEKDRLEDLARALGADVPACIHSSAMRGEGRGDELQPVDLGLAGTPVLLVNPREELSTAEVFARWDGIDRGGLDDWRNGRNDLQQAAEALVPQIGLILAWLSTQQGASHVRMSGSGATCFALFDTEAQRDRAEMGLPREWWRLATRLR